LKSFLQETAEDIVNKFGKDLNGIELIFPNKRTDFHFKRSLGQALEKTSWSPKTFTIQRFAGILTNLTNLDKISLLFELYHTFKEVDKQFNYDFDSFYKLGEIILHDFNEIDNYLVDASQIFTNIRDIHEIDAKYDTLSEEQIKIIRQYWQNFSPEKKSKEKEQFLKLWNILLDVYSNLKNRLLSKKLGYEGLIYKELANKISSNQLKDSDNIKIFIGFNALNQAQKKLFKYLKNNNKAVFYWDNDSYYHHNKIQEAGDFLRKNYEILNEDPDSVPGNFKAINKSINLIGVPGNIGQAKAIPQLLKNLSNNEGKLMNPEKTVVVLPDENMLFPVLNSIPEFIEKLNITMGYPLKNTALYSLLIYIIRVQQTINQEDKKSIRIYHKDVMAILSHPLIKSRYQTIVEKLTTEITLKQMIYVSNKILLGKENKLFEEIFSPVLSGQPEDSASKILNILFLLFVREKEAIKTESKSFEDEYIYHTYIAIKRLYEVLKNEAGAVKMGFNVVLQFIKQVLNNISVPFESESTDGLQIMGLIETRNIDFENVILLNANEGILPKLNRPPSLISESMRYAFELPVLKYQDSIFAYFFYRLLQRAKNIYILYDNLGSSNRSGEVSRFVYQLELESGFKITKLQLIQNVKLIKSQFINIQKNKTIQEKLSMYFVENGVSKKQLTASSIDTYLNCHFQFYLRYIAGIKEPEQVEEEFSPVEMGIIIHSTMENLFKDLIQRKGQTLVEKADFKEIFQDIDAKLKQSFLNHLNIENSEDFEYTGNLLIIKEVIKKYLEYILKFDEKRAPFEIVHLEDSELYKLSLEIDFQDKKVFVGLKGIIDRIDKTKEGLFVIDYKTGKADKDYKILEDLTQEDSKLRKKAISQIFLYGLLINENPKFSGKNITPYIYDIRNMYKKSFDPSISYKIENEKISLQGHVFKDILEDYKERLKQVVQDIFNTNNCFEQTTIPDNCKYCSYKAICGKEG
jgi:RecB family exonuclease